MLCQFCLNMAHNKMKSALEYMLGYRPLANILHRTEQDHPWRNAATFRPPKIMHFLVDYAITIQKHAAAIFAVHHISTVCAVRLL
jgi:hypothetical protein